MEISQVTPEIIQAVKENHEHLKSVSKTRQAVNQTLGINLSQFDVTAICKGLFDDKLEITGEEAMEKMSNLTRFMEERGITVKDLKELFYQRDISGGAEHNIDIGAGRKFKVGIVSDTHLAAKSCAIQELNAFYDIMEEQGIRHVLNAGDVTDGGGHVYKGQLAELSAFGFDDTVEYVDKNYPMRKGITTHFISGNHDEDFLKTGGASVGDAISHVRSDLKHLGFYDANITIGGIRFGLHHGAGGGAYAQSYKIQKAVENLTGDAKPQVYVLGHFHTSLYLVVRNIHCFMPGCFQKPTNFSRRLNLPNTVGGWILEIEKTKKNEIRNLTPKYTAFYF